MSSSFTCPVCGMTSHHPDDVQQGFCGSCHDWTRAAGRSAIADWGPEIYPDHYWREGCCDLPAAEHPLTPDEARERRDWGETEPGLRERLARREAQYARLAELDAGPVLLANQRRLVNDIRRMLREPVMEGEELG